MLDKSTKRKEDRMFLIAIRNAGMKQNDIARVLNVSQSAVKRPLKEHRESGSITKRNVRGALSDDHLIQLKVVTGTLNAQKYQDEILESGVRSPLDSLDGQITVLQDNCKTSLYLHHPGMQKSTEHH